MQLAERERSGEQAKSASVAILTFSLHVTSDGARCLEVGGVHENPDSPEAFHKRRMHEFANLD